MPRYLALLINAGYAGDARVLAGLEWLLTQRQAGGGWIVPLQTVPAKARTSDMWPGPAIPPDRTQPFSHLATGMVLRAFAAHPTYRRQEEVLAAARPAQGSLLPC